MTQEQHDYEMGCAAKAQAEYELQMLNLEQKPPLRKTPVRCSVCGCFMRRLKLLEKVRLGLLPDTNYTHICKRSGISYETGVMEHE